MIRQTRLISTLLTLAALVALTAAPAAANTSYTYTAANYTDIFGGTNIPGDYSTAMFAVGTMEFASPLGLNFDGDVNPIHYSFTDGRFPYTDQTPVGPQVLMAHMTTDGTGAITHWLILLRGDEDPAFHRELNFSDETLFTKPYFTFAHINTQGLSIPISLDEAGSRNVGAWSLTPVPEAGSLNLLLIGVAALGLRLRKTRNSVYFM